MRIFVLEDDPARLKVFVRELIGHEVITAIDVEYALRLWEPPYDVICLDHDLGDRQFVDSDDPNTGYTFVMRPEVQEGIGQAIVLVHSFNAAGALRMMAALPTTLKAYLPFGSRLFGHIKAIGARA